MALCADGPGTGVQLEAKWTGSLGSLACARRGMWRSARSRMQSDVGFEGPFTSVNRPCRCLKLVMRIVREDWLDIAISGVIIAPPPILAAPLPQNCSAAQQPIEPREFATTAPRPPGKG